jgi:hypothetical protein
MKRILKKRDSSEEDISPKIASFAFWLFPLAILGISLVGWWLGRGREPTVVHLTTTQPRLRLPTQPAQPLTLPAPLAVSQEILPPLMGETGSITAPPVPPMSSHVDVVNGQPFPRQKLSAEDIKVPIEQIESLGFLDSPGSPIRKMELPPGVMLQGTGGSPPGLPIPSTPIPIPSDK